MTKPATIAALGALLTTILGLVGLVVLAALKVEIPSALYAILGVSTAGHLGGLPTTVLGGPSTTTTTTIPPAPVAANVAGVSTGGNLP